MVVFNMALRRSGNRCTVRFRMSINNFGSRRKNIVQQSTSVNDSPNLMGCCPRIVYTLNSDHNVRLAVDFGTPHTMFPTRLMQIEISASFPYSIRESYIPLAPNEEQSVFKFICSYCNISACLQTKYTNRTDRLNMFDFDFWEFHLFYIVGVCLCQIFHILHIFLKLGGQSLDMSRNNCTVISNLCF